MGLNIKVTEIKNKGLNDWDIYLDIDKGSFHLKKVNMMKIKKQEVFICDTIYHDVRRGKEETCVHCNKTFKELECQKMKKKITDIIELTFTEETKNKMKELKKEEVSSAIKQADDIKEKINIVSYYPDKELRVINIGFQFENKDYFMVDSLNLNLENAKIFKREESIEELEEAEQLMSFSHFLALKQKFYESVCDGDELEI